MHGFAHETKQDGLAGSPRRDRQISRCGVRRIALTAVSQTVRTMLDVGVLTGHLVDPDLRKRIGQHRPDHGQSSGGQGVAGSNPAVPTDEGHVAILRPVAE